MKKRWQKPELVILVRSKPEETVLAVCKGNGMTVAPTDWNDTCDNTDGTCTNCDSNVAS